MNDLTIQRQSQFSASSERSALTVELGKMLGLVAPVTMSGDQQALWLASAVEALDGIRASEVAAVSMEVRRSVSSYTKIIPEISRLVAERRAASSRLDKLRSEDEELRRLPPPKKHIQERDRSKFTEADWAELNEYLERQGSPVRYSADGKKLAA